MELTKENIEVGTPLCVEYDNGITYKGIVSQKGPELFVLKYLYGHFYLVFSRCKSLRLMNTN